MKQTRREIFSYLCARIRSSTGISNEVRQRRHELAEALNDFIANDARVPVADIVRKDLEALSEEDLIQAARLRSFLEYLNRPKKVLS